MIAYLKTMHISGVKYQAVLNDDFTLSLFKDNKDETKALQEKYGEQFIDQIGRHLVDQMKLLDQRISQGIFQS